MEGFTETQKQELRELLASAVQDARADVCGCHISDEMKREMPHLEQSIRTIGCGKLDRGVERARANHEFVAEVRDGKKMLRIAVFRWAAIVMVAYLGWAAWIGMVAKIADTTKAGGA